ncbi:MAG: TonB family protein [Candidatus Omnitrophica bacterium]|nr:TonB family protein [Candidatus Omnitrophota bacterium]
MPDNKTFQFALIASILFHSIFFLAAPHMPFTPSKRALKNIEITYYEIKKPAAKKELANKKSEPLMKRLPDIKKEEILNPPKPIAKKPDEVKQPVKPVAELVEAKEKTFEKVVEEEKDDAKKATYISYYRAVREKIRQYADRNYPATRRLGRGEIFLSFVVASSGELLRVKVIEERSVVDRTLRDIAINSIREASPFPPFPKGMRQYQITFNIIISFELNK